MIVDAGQFLLGSFFNDAMIRLRFLLGVIIPFGLVLLRVVTAFASDNQDDLIFFNGGKDKNGMIG
jgi:hypothetical protein